MEALEWLRVLSKIVQYGSDNFFCTSRPHLTTTCEVVEHSGIRLVFNNAYSRQGIMFDEDVDEDEDEDEEDPQRFSFTDSAVFKDPDETLGPQYVAVRMLFWAADEVCNEIEKCLSLDREDHREHDEDEEESGYESEDDADASEESHEDFEAKEHERQERARDRAQEFNATAKRHADYIEKIRNEIGELIATAAAGAVPASWDDYRAIQRYSAIKKKSTPSGEV